MKTALRKINDFMKQGEILLAVYDENDRLAYANQKYRQVFFLEPEAYPTWAEIMRSNYHARRGTVISSPDFELWLKSTLSRRGKIPYRAFETDNHDGRWLFMTETVDEDGWMFCLATDITDLRAPDRDLRLERDIALKSSLTDELTGIANRRFVIARLAAMMQMPLTPAQPSTGCFAIFDVDDFKQVNDSFGHQSGDRLLVSFAQEISRLVRRIDCFGRLGGEEFGLVLPGANPDEAKTVVERMMSQVRTLSPLQSHPALRITFSAGISAAKPYETYDALYGRADAALYQAKRRGKDRLCLTA